MVCLLRPVTTSSDPSGCSLATFRARFGSVGGIVSQSFHVSSKSWKNWSRFMPNLVHDAHVSRSSSSSFVPSRSFARLHQGSIVAAKTPSRSTAIFSVLVRRRDNSAWTIGPVGFNLGLVMTVDNAKGNDRPRGNQHLTVSSKVQDGPCSG